MGTKRWADLNRRQRSTLVAAAGVQLVLLVAALRDIRRRPSDQVNGPKRLWEALAFVNFVGPISYFLFGRKN